METNGVRHLAEASSAFGRNVSSDTCFEFLAAQPLSPEWPSSGCGRVGLYRLRTALIYGLIQVVLCLLLLRIAQDLPRFPERHRHPRSLFRCPISRNCDIGPPEQPSNPLRVQIFSREDGNPCYVGEGSFESVGWPKAHAQVPCHYLFELLNRRW